MLDDFAMRIAGRVIHVLNAPSPAASTSLAIGDFVCVRVHDAFIGDS